ncbi:putative transglutaminase-like cysteine proteinase [Rhodoligotrophos appendicifer]|uniref:transglutaminase-like cysteine peptidase n=1 Tax=Rhodoligotrophos appendicifer TaxID=987056 RepID=UPI001186C46B|nr:transglutaminase-like cysteine peptidase [Rhodoligotrophos appendicifer]
MKRLFTGIVLIAAVFLAASAKAQTADDGFRLSTTTVFAKAHEKTLPPMGFIDFCRRNPGSCAVQRSSGSRVELNPARLSELIAVNDRVNGSITPATDQEIYGVEEYWTMSSNRGDCEDYVLLKQHYLQNLGWPRSSLLITVVIDERGDGHAVLTVKTTGGDLILDNQNPDVLDWTETPYQYVKRQSSRDPKIWEALDVPAHTATSGLPAK